MNFAFHPEAEAEFLEAIVYYEERAQGLGLDFSTEVRTAIQRILGSWMYRRTYAMTPSFRPIRLTT